MISIIIPTLNEEKNIGKVIDDLKKHAPLNSQIMIVDSGSQDETLKIAKEKGIEIYQLDVRGKGKAMRFGAEEAKGEILVFIDGDGSYSPSGLGRLIEPILQERADIVYGSRFLPNSKREISLIRYLGNKLFILLGFLLYGKTTDFLTGFFGIKKDAFSELNLKSNGFEIETEIFAKAAKKNLKMEEVPIEYTKSGESKLNPLKDGFKILITLLINKIS